jgi:hypothetical protein
LPLYTPIMLPIISGTMIMLRRCVLTGSGFSPEGASRFCKVDKEISSRSEHFKHRIHKHEAQMKFHISLNSLTQTHELTALRSFLIKAMGLRFKPLWNLLPKYQPIKPYNQSETMEILHSYTFLHYIFCCTAEEILTSTIILPYKLLVGIHSRWIMNMVEKQKPSETLETPEILSRC